MRSRDNKMIKKLKLGMLTLSVLALFGVASYANAQALTFSDTTYVTIGSKTYNIDSTSEATSVVVGSASITIEVPAASTVVFASPDRFDLDNDGSLTQVCASGSSYLTITGAATVVVTPNTSNVCEGGGSGGGGGGGSSKAATPATPATPAVPASSYSGLCPNGNTIASNCSAKPATPATPASPNAQGYAFGTLTIKMNTKGEECKAWQTFFNAHGANPLLVVDGWCGKLTIAAAKVWQVSQGLAGDGLLGPLSRAKAMMQ